MKYALIALALLVTGCVTDNSYKASFEQCEGEAGRNNNLCDSSPSED